MLHRLHPCKMPLIPAYRQLFRPQRLMACSKGGVTAVIPIHLSQLLWESCSSPVLASLAGQLGYHVNSTPAACSCG